MVTLLEQLELLFHTLSSAVQLIIVNSIAANPTKCQMIILNDRDKDRDRVQTLIQLIFSNY